MLSKIFKYTGCIVTGTITLLIIILAVYFLLPGRQNILILGIDAREEEGDLGRTDTMMVASIDPLRPYIGIMSIPRDLWVDIPGYGKNRINTAHFYAESQVAGDGPNAAMEVVENNFGIDIASYVRIRFDNFVNIIDMLDGVDLKLDYAMSGLPAGVHHMNGEQALAFVRDRSGSDDFYRMERGQLLIKALLTKMLRVQNWELLPEFLGRLHASIDSNISIRVLWRVIITFLRINPENIDFRLISREMVTPFTTEGGAAVLAPKWELIHPVIRDVFGQ